MKRRIIAVVLCFVIFASCFFVNTVKSEAIATLLFMEGEALIAPILSAFGYDVTQEGFAEACQNAYDSMSSGMHATLAQAALGVTYAGYGMAKVEFTQAQWNEVIDWYNLNSTTLNSTFTYGESLPTNYSNYTTSTWNGFTSVTSAYSSYSGNKIMVWDGSSTAYQNRYYAYTGDIQVLFKSDNTTELYAGPNGCTQHKWSGNYGYEANIISAGSSMTGAKIYQFSGALSIITAYNVIIGSLKTGTQTMLEQLSLFNPTTHPVWPNVTGSYELDFPVAETPSTGIDEGINMPSTTSDNPICLDDVIAWYGSLQAYFDAGNVITLADGTTLSGTNEYTRSTDMETLPDVTTGTDIAKDVGLIGNILSGIWTLIQNISDTLSRFFDTSDFSLNLDPLKVNLFNRFPFCLPFDFKHLIDVFSAQPSDYEFNLSLNTTWLKFNHTVDLSPFMMPIRFFRYVVVVFFIYILISKTRDLIKW